MCPYLQTEIAFQKLKVVVFETVFTVHVKVTSKRRKEYFSIVDCHKILF